MSREWTGRLQVYTGEGKGKTTAAIGLAVRAAGAGLHVFIGQFLKGMHYSELDALGKLSEFVTVRQYGQDRFVIGTPSDEDIRVAREGLADADIAIRSGEYRVVILDEANVAVALGLFSVDELLAIIAGRPENVEIVVTGRDASAQIIECADLVTEMRVVKHYYDEGVKARRGIEC